MRWCLALVILVVVMWSGSIGHADDTRAPAGWSEASRSRDLTIFYQDNDRAHARAFQAVGDVNAPPDAVFAVVTDVEAHPRFMPFIKESRIIQRLGPNDVLVYQVISPPLVSNRDAVLHVVTTPGSSPTSIWRSSWTAVPDALPERSGHVRLRIAEGTWLLEPLDGGTRTHVTYTALTNVGGSIPSWMSNSSSLSVLKTMYDAIRRRVAEVAPATQHS